MFSHRKHALLFASVTLAGTAAAQDAARFTRVPGNVRPQALVAANDRGEVDAALPLNHMLLQLKRTPDQEAALDAYIAELNDASSPNFHKWLTPADLGTRFGPAASEIEAVKAWLTGAGFQVNSVAVNGMTIDFSGTAGQVAAAFHTSMHHLSMNGETHVANVEDPGIPSALTGVVAGIASLNDFRPQTLHRAVRTAHFDPRTGSQAAPEYTYSSGGSTYQAVVPGDLAAIYSLQPLFASGISGQGQTIVVIEDTDVYSTADWSTFRSTFGLAGYKGSFTQTHPGNCADPGVNADDGEAILDAEWATAAAPSAAVVLASCADTNTTFGGLIALNNLVNSTNPPKIVSISYGESEELNGATANLAYAKAYQAAAAAGISVFVASGDEGAASSDANATHARNGITVSGFASTPYNVAVGGTDFGDTYAGTNTNYWNANNTGTYASAKGYIPEIPWNDSCASQLIVLKSGYSYSFGTNGFCNSRTGRQDYLTTAAGSGGPSGCATGSPAPFSPGVASGSCKGYAKPSYQNGIVGLPSDGVRDIPDVSLFAANGVWGHYYVYCYTDAVNGGAPCTGAPSGWSGAGGTSFASPIMAAIQSLVNQKTNSAWGNPNPTYYNLARAEYGSAGNSSCNSSNGGGSGQSCTFHDVTEGDNTVVCSGSVDCYRPSGTYGFLSDVNGGAYRTTNGWDFSTGIGTVNAQNLVNQWGTVAH